MIGDDKKLIKCYKCEYYHWEDDKGLGKESKDDKWICSPCRNFDTRSKQDLRVGGNFDKGQQIIIKDIAYRIRLLELENQGQQAKIEKLESELKKSKK